MLTTKFLHIHVYAVNIRVILLQGIFQIFMDSKDNMIINLSHLTIHIKIKINCTSDTLLIYLIRNIGYEIMVNDNNNHF